LILDGAQSAPSNNNVVSGPTISTQPNSTSVNPGATAIFTVTATGTGSLMYQWQVNTGSGFSDMTGETNASLSLTNVTSGMSGYQYRVKVTDGNSLTTTSNGATLTVNASISPVAESFDKNPANQADVDVTLTLNGNTLSSIQNGGATLVAGTDYTATGSTVTLKKSYLAQQAVGTTNLMFNFSSGPSQRLTITVSDTTPSGNADLSNIRINGHLLSNFSPSVTEYTYHVPNEITDVSVTGSVYDSTATVQVTGGHGLLVGSNRVTLDVTAQNHSTKQYMVDIVRANGGSSSKTDLSGLVVNQGTLTPSFDPGITSYSFDVPNGTDSLSVTASVYDPNATIQMNGVPVASGMISNPISLQVGSNVIQVVILAQDGVTSKTYTLNVTRSGHSSDSSSGGGGGVSSATISGQLTVSSSQPGTSATEASSPAAWTKMLGSNVSLTATVLTTDGKSNSIPDIAIGPNGQFQLGSNVAPGQYHVIINVTAPTGEVLAGKSGTLTVSSNGTASMQTDLLDPYGVIQDSITKQPISGVNVKLYWADTDLNRSKGRTPGTVVKLPELPDFAPNKNHNPQVSTPDGRYGWMLFPDGDYYVIAEKEGYDTYDSRNDQRDEQQGDTSYIRNGLIHVGKTNVSLNFIMTNKNVTSTNHEGYVKGYPDGTFRPGNSITRAELAAILSRVLPLSSTVETKNAYQDVPTTHWAMQPIEEMTGNQEMGGYPDGTFHPDSPITRAEMASIVTRVKHLESNQKATFTDTTNHWAAASIGAVQTAGFMGGYEDGTFHPDQLLTRAETVTIVNRILGRSISKNIDQPTWRDVPSTFWAYDQIEEASR
jgi:hypothetical protein